MIKVGDKIKVLPSAIDACVPKRMIGETVKITYIFENPFPFLVYIVYDNTTWGLRGIDFEPVVKVGEQLLFPFMQE